MFTQLQNKNNNKSILILKHSHQQIRFDDGRKKVKIKNQQKNSRTRDKNSRYIDYENEISFHFGKIYPFVLNF